MDLLKRQKIERQKVPEGRLTFDEYYNHESLPTPLDPSVYGEDFNTKLRNKLLYETNLRVVDKVDILYPYRDAVMRAVLEEVEFQLDHRAEHNHVRQEIINQYIKSGTFNPNRQFRSIVEKMRYGTHNAAEAGYILTSLPEEFDGVEVKKFTKFDMELQEFHYEAYKTLGVFQRTLHNDSELGVTDVRCVRNIPESFKEIDVAGAAPVGVFKQPLAICDQNGQTIELITRGSYVTLPHRGRQDEHKIISMQQYVRRYRPENYSPAVQQKIQEIALGGAGVELDFK